MALENACDICELTLIIPDGAIFPGNFQFETLNVVLAGSTSEITSEKILKTFAVFEEFVFISVITKSNCVLENPTAAILSLSMNPDPPSAISTLSITPANVFETIAVGATSKTGVVKRTGSPTL